MSDSLRSNGVLGVCVVIIGFLSIGIITMCAFGYGVDEVCAGSVSSGGPPSGPGAACATEAGYPDYWCLCPNRGNACGTPPSSAPCGKTDQGECNKGAPHDFMTYKWEDYCDDRDPGEDCSSSCSHVEAGEKTVYACT